MAKKSKKGVHIVQYPADVSLCAGCASCEVVCALIHDGKSGPSHNRIFLNRDTIGMIHRVDACQQCEDTPCYSACRKKDQAMCVDESGIIYINQENCIGCKQCIKACPFEPKRINYNKETKKALKCDLCRDRAEGPACIAYCQVRCIGLSDQPVPVPPAPSGAQGPH